MADQKPTFTLAFCSSHRDTRIANPTAVALVAMSGGSTIKEYHSLIGPAPHYKTGVPLYDAETGALEYAGIRHDEWLKAPSPKTVCREMAGFLKDVRGVGYVYYAPFEMAMLESLERHASDWHPAKAGERSPGYSGVTAIITDIARYVRIKSANQTPMTVEEAAESLGVSDSEGDDITRALWKARLLAGMVFALKK